MADSAPPARRYPNEIIEFPCILLQWRKYSEHATDPDGRNADDPPDGDGDDDDGASDGTDDSEDEGEVEWRLEVVDEFHSFVKPTWKPELSAFCTELTGIKQVSPSRTGAWGFATERQG